MSIVLVGLPGSGKSTVARHIGRQAAWRVIDTDALVEQHVGMSVRDYFDKAGEEAFRDEEQDVIAHWATQPNLVIATGGGAVLRAANRSALRRGNHVVYLHQSPDEVARRMASDTRRPLLQGGDLVQRYRELFRQRDGLYRQTAHYVIDAGRSNSVTRMVRLVAMQLELAGVLPR